MGQQNPTMTKWLKAGLVTKVFEQYCGQYNEHFMIVIYDS